MVGTLQWVNERGQVQLVAEEVTPVGEGAIAELIADDPPAAGGGGSARPPPATHSGVCLP